MKDWIWSAIQAAHVYKEDEHYVIKDNKIIPVDYRNTGCLQNNVEWEHGLHQFLQIKHNLEVSVESMTSNFMSNIGHFTRYKTIYGLTGTLGSHESKKFLQKTYSAEMLEIPPFL
jgi:preprotein translocase subunit SecA